MAMIRHIL